MSRDGWLPRTLGESVLEEFARFGPAGAIAEIVAAWPAAVGPAIAEHAWPARVARDGALVVATSSSVWAFELTQLEGTVSGRLAEALGEAAPRRLKFVPGRLPERAADSAQAPGHPHPPEPGSEACREGERLAAPIEDEELRELAARAAAASLARAAARPDGRPL